MMSDVMSESVTSNMLVMTWMGWVWVGVNARKDVHSLVGSVQFKGVVVLEFAFEISIMKRSGIYLIILVCVFSVCVLVCGVVKEEGGVKKGDGSGVSKSGKKITEIGRAHV